MEEPPQQDGNSPVIRQDAEVNGQNPSHEEPEVPASSLPVTGATKDTFHCAEVSTAPQVLSRIASPQPTAASPPNPTSGLNVQSSESQPMTAVTSTSSSIPTMHGSSSNDVGGPSPYGTRSRNRAGTNRINYAEDREMDNEYEWPSTKKAQIASTTASSAQASENDKTSSSARRRSLQGAAPSNSTRSNGAVPGGPKDHIPGTSSFSVTSDTNGTSHPQSKKRKAPGTHASSSQPSPHGSVSTSTRLAHHAQSSSGTTRETNMLTFETSQGYLKHGKLVADDGTRLGVNDYVYLVCEPPGEPYYIARLMEFIHFENDTSMPIETLRINWVYRPRDIGRKVNDTRLVYASMHSDTCPRQSLRGKCQVQHRDKITSIEDYRKMKNCFYFSQMFDRYMRRYYDVIPTNQVINVPERVKKVLDERWTYVIVETGRGKELTGAIKSCKRCSGYCASNDSVDCAMCKNTYHMNCVRPPLLKKPARGFAWSCGPCSRRQERKLEARNTPLVGERALDGEEEEYIDEDEEEHATVLNQTTGSSPENPGAESGLRPATTEQLAQAKLWPYRYLGIHCKVEDALDYDDRIYPRAISRLGPRHQANVINWHGRPLEYVKPADIKKKYLKGSSHKKDAKLSKDTVSALEAEKLAREKRPKWVIDEPPGFVHRGEDHPNGDPANTAKICFRLPEVGESSSRGQDDNNIPSNEQMIEKYMNRARKFAPSLGIPEYSTNFLDRALQYLYNNSFDAEAAFKQLQAVDLRKDLKEPKLNKEEVKRFEDGVSKYGTNLHEVARHVGKPQKHGDIVRFYYMWKKTERGRQIWGNFEGRKNKKPTKQVEAALVDDVADDVDDSAFDNDKAAIRKRGFECKFCSTRHSRYWRRAPGTAPGTTVLADPVTKGSKDKGVHLMVALCHRCAGLWRRYAIQWENIDEVAKKVAQAGGRAWKRKMDEELLIELVNANEASSVGISSTAVAAAASVGIDIPSSLTIQPEQEATRKKLKVGMDKELAQQPLIAQPVEFSRKKVIEKPPEPPLVPDQPKIKILPCFVCNQMEPSGEEHFTCRHCRLTVHRNCYGIPAGRSASKWTCDMCVNDTSCQLSTSYECVLCPVRYNEYELMEPPKASHKKKSDREREKERLEKELTIEAIDTYNRKQNETGRPLYPREPLKRTSGNNWVHVVCAVWTSCIKFGSAKLLEPAEGLGSIPQARYGQVCKLCKTTVGVCTTCHKCPATFHVGCAQQNGLPMGFDVTPVKSSRKDVINTITLGSETGNVEAVIYCKDHAVKTILHPMYELIEGSTNNALQQFVQNFKQADLSLTGTVRKAAIISSFMRSSPQGTSTNGHRSSISNAPNVGVSNSPVVPATRSSRVSPTAVTVKSEEVDEDGDRVVHLNELINIEPFAKECISCGTDVSPKWHSKSTNKPSSSDIHWSEADTALSRPEQQNPEMNATADKVNINENNGVSAGRNAVADVVGPQNGQLPQRHELLGTERKVGMPRILPRPSLVTTISSTDPVEIIPEYLCHRCHLKKLKEPSPSPVATPREPSLERAAPPPPDDVQVVEPRAPSPLPWAPVSAIRPMHPESWPPQPPPQSGVMVRLTNGMNHSPPQHMVAPAQPPYVPPPQAHYHLNGYDHRDQHHGPPMQHPVNGGPSLYQGPRTISAPMQHSPYAPQLQNHEPAPYARPMPNGTRSPPIHYRVAQAPPGPPRATENPFEMPHSSHASPRQHYYGSHGGSRVRGHDERPETPTEGERRNGGWTTTEGPMANGASASPSLRNLLH
ncbi:putative PHD type zinc finger protein with BAH domain-containing protein [Xylographa carneopallida]|nr:putative PHD type zinc finger protein with BAH domain-containing protein [Xylographa carneopallida]